MLSFVLYPLWKALKRPLKSALDNNFSLLGGHFKALLSTTIDDLIWVLQNESFNTDVWRHYATGEIWDRNKGRSDGTILSVKAFPPSAIAGAEGISSTLRQRIAQNVRLDALRSDIGITDGEWMEILASYSAEVVRHGLIFAFKRMLKHGLALDGSDYVIDVAQAEPIRVAGQAGHHTLVILYRLPNSGKPSVSKAKNIWKHRMKSSYLYELEEYDGFKAG